jgi:hypothetical protein
MNSGFTMVLVAGLSVLSACDNNGPSSVSVISPRPGASLKCASSGKNAWDTYGVSAFVAVNERIFTNVGTEMSNNGTANLGDSFTRVGTSNPHPATDDSAATFKGNLAAFLVYAYGGPAQITYTDGITYQGPQSMEESHQGLNITSSQYNYFVNSIIVPALTTSGVPSSDISTCFAPPLVDSSFKASIVGQ